jgi:hypothetical protein
LIGRVIGARTSARTLVTGDPGAGGYRRLVGGPNLPSRPRTELGGSAPAAGARLHSLLGFVTRLGSPCQRRAEPGAAGVPRPPRQLGLALRRRPGAYRHVSRPGGPPASRSSRRWPEPCAPPCRPAAQRPAHPSPLRSRRGTTSTTARVSRHGIARPKTQEAGKPPLTPCSTFGAWAKRHRTGRSRKGKRVPRRRLHRGGGSGAHRSSALLLSSGVDLRALTIHQVNAHDCESSTRCTRGSRMSCAGGLRRRFANCPVSSTRS